MNKNLKQTISFAFALAVINPIAAINGSNETNNDYSETEGYTININTASASSKIIQEMQPTIKFGGYIMSKYSINDQKGKKSNGGFDFRFVRLYASGYVYKDFFYKLQMEINGAPGDDKGPRIVDAFAEWQKYDFFRVKMGQFKRSFGFENPYSPMAVGLGSYSQASLKLASIKDRISEHKSSGRDLGAQIQGDLFTANDGHKWLHYQIGVFNGQGINHSDKDHHKDLIGGLWLSPIKNLAIGGFGWDGQYTNEKYNAENPNCLSSVKRVRWGAGLKYESDWTVRGEYMHSVGGIPNNASAPDRADAWYATVGVPVLENFKVYGRYDCYRYAKTWNSLNTNYGISGNYNLGKNLIFQLNYTFTDNRNLRNSSHPTDSHYNTFDVQVTARF